MMRRQIDINSIYRSHNKLNIPKNPGTHYSRKIDSQIKIPLPGFNDFFEKLNRM